MNRRENIASRVYSSQDPMDALTERGLSLQILDDDIAIFESRGSGMKPLLEAIQVLGRTRLRGTVVVDKIVGKAAALLMAYFGPRIVFCGTISRRAEVVLDRYRISYDAETIVPEICRPGSSELCPFEESVLDVETPLRGYHRLFLRLFRLMSLVR